MKFSKKLLLTQIAALAASSAAFADRNVTEYIGKWKLNSSTNGK